jgi:predicted transcriptional regulator
MVLADERILEYIREKGSGAPKEMADSGYVRYSRQYISQRAKNLVDHGLLQHLGNGVYIITDEGEAYLDEEYDANKGVYINRDVADTDDAATSAGTNEANGT